MPRSRLVLLVAVLGSLAGAAPAAADVTSFSLTPEAPQAASHAPLTFTASLSGTNRSVRVDLPAGFLGQVAGVPTCSEASFQAGTCADASRVGSASSQATAIGMSLTASGDIDLLAPQAGEAARLGVTLSSSLAQPIRVEVPVTVRDEGDFGLTSVIPIPSQANFVLLGIPIDITVTSLTTTLDAKTGGGLPFATMPPTCGQLTGSAAASADGTTYQATPATDTITPTGCGDVPFTPSVAFETTSKAAGGPTGVTVRLTEPAGDAAQAQSPIASSTVTLPAGMALNPAALPGLLGAPCASLADAVAAKCEAAKMGTVAVDTPAGTLTGSAYFTLTGGTGIFLVAQDANDAIHLRLRATTTPTAPVVTTLTGLPPTLATRFELSFTTRTTPLFVNPCTPTAQGSAQLTSASGPTATPTASITTTGVCQTTPPATTTTTTTTPPATTETTPATTATTPPATTQTTPATTTTRPTTTSAAPPATTATAATVPATTPAKPRARLRVSLRRLGGRRVQVRTLVLAGPSRCDGTVRVTVNRGVRSTRLARRTVKLPASCLVRTSFVLPRAARGRHVSAQVALRGASELQDATVRTRQTRLSRG